MRYFILIKRKTSKKWLGAIPTKKGISLNKVRSVVKSNIKQGFSYKIITDTQLKSMLKSRSRHVTRRIRKKKVVRKRKIRRKRLVRHKKR